VFLPVTFIKALQYFHFLTQKSKTKKENVILHWSKQALDKIKFRGF